MPDSSAASDLTADRTDRFLYPHRYLILLIALLVFSALQPAFQPVGGHTFLLNLLFCLILLSATYAISRRRGIANLAAAFAGLAFLVTWVDYSLGGGWLNLVEYVCDLAFLSLTACVISYDVFRGHRITADRILGAVCIYVLIGVVFALMYAALAEVSEFAFDRGHGLIDGTSADRKTGTFHELLYYSFVTLSTLGYGDITPKSPPARTLSWLEAVSGQVYLAVLVARLVGLYTAHEIRRFDGREAQTAGGDHSPSDATG